MQVAALSLRVPIVCKTTAPPTVYEQLEARVPEVVHAPEFLRQAHARYDIEHAELLVYGGAARVTQLVARLEAEIAATTEEEARKKLQRRLRYFHTRQSTAEVQTPPTDGSVGIGSRVTYRLKKAEKFCRRILELSNQEKFVDVEVKMEAGRVTIWYEKVKVKP